MFNDIIANESHAMNKAAIADILTTTADFAFLLVDSTGIITSANPAVRTIFGRQEGEIEGLRINEVVPEVEMVAQLEFDPVQARGGIDMFDAEVEVSDCRFMEALAAEHQRGETFEAQYNLNGQVKWLEIFASKLLHDGNIVFTVIIQDITKRKKDEQEIRELNQNLEKKVEERTADLHARTEQIKRVVKGCGEQLEHINQTYQSMKERQMNIIENLETNLLAGIESLTDIQRQSLKNTLREQLVESMNIYSEDQITDQKFLMAILSLNELFSGESETSKNLKPGEIAGSSQADVDDLLDAFGI